jgi:hypothetical protein
MYTFVTIPADIDGQSQTLRAITCQGAPSCPRLLTLTGWAVGASSWVCGECAGSRCAATTTLQGGHAGARCEMPPGHSGDHVHRSRLGAYSWAQRVELMEPCPGCTADAGWPGHDPDCIRATR